MTRILQYIQLLLTSSILISLPMLGASCQSARLTPAQQAASEEAMAQGDTATADQIQHEANAEQTKGWVDFVLDFIPVPEHLKAPVGAGATGLIVHGLFPRPRSLWKKAFKDMGKSLKEVNFVGSQSQPGVAGADALSAAKAIAAVFGVKHTSDDPDEVIANGQKLKAKMAEEAAQESGVR
jgi:hypothetical protein